MSLSEEKDAQEVAHSPAIESLVDLLVEQTIARIERLSLKPFLHSKECAELLGVTPEHLCAMRSRGQGPQWSGEGKWIRYERRVAVAWLASLPRETKHTSEPTQLVAGASNHE